jgi:hypothetical protein
MGLQDLTTHNIVFMPMIRMKMWMKLKSIGMGDTFPQEKPHGVS